MRKSMTERLLILFGILILSAVPAMAQSGAAKSAKFNPRDYSGVWGAVGSNDISEHMLPGEEIAFTPYGAERYRKLDHKSDPSNLCQPVGFFRPMQTPLMPFQFVQGPDVTTVLMEYHYSFRLIYTDGRNHPEDIADYPEWMGHSTGKWEGDTLVVDTIGFNDKTWLDTPGLQHSEKLHTTERFQKTGPDTIKWTITINDPVFFKKPFTYMREFKKQDTRIMSYSCSENERDYAHMQSVLGALNTNKKVLKFPN